MSLKTCLEHKKDHLKNVLAALFHAKGDWSFQPSKSAINVVQMSRHIHFYDPFLVFLELDSFIMNYDEIRTIVV